MIYVKIKACRAGTQKNLLALSFSSSECLYFIQKTTYSTANMKVDRPNAGVDDVKSLMWY